MSCLHPIIARGPEVGSFGLLGVCVVLMWLPVVFFGSPSIWKDPTCSILMLFSFEGNSALVLSFLMSEFWSVSCYDCSFVWVFCIRLAMFSFCVTYLFLLAVEIWPKKIVNFLAKMDRFLIPKKGTEPNGCRFSLTSESRLRRRGVRRAQWLHVFPRN